MSNKTFMANNQTVTHGWYVIDATGLTLGRLATTEDTAKLCLFLLSDDAGYISGENISINGGRI